jgi:hypothetical protein
LEVIEYCIVPSQVMAKKIREEKTLDELLTARGAYHAATVKLQRKIRMITPEVFINTKI